MSHKSKTYGMRIREALARGRHDIADEVRKERNDAYTGDLYKLVRELERQLNNGSYGGAQGTLNIIAASAGRKKEALEFEVALKVSR